MQGNFKYSNPTKLYFGEDALNSLGDELRNYGQTVMLCYGGGSIKRNGIYDSIVEMLHKAGKTVVEDAGVMPNPTVEKLYEGAAMAKKNNVDRILAERVGMVRGRCLAEILSATGSAHMQDYSGGNGADYGGHGKRDERRKRDNQP